MIKRLALTKDGQMTLCSATEENIGKGRCNHIAHQAEGESKSQFVKRLNRQESLYNEYIVTDEQRKGLEKQLKECIPDDLVENVKINSHGKSWIIAYGYYEDAYCNRGGWNNANPYPFVTSDGKSFIDLYIGKNDIYSITEDNFVTPYNKNKDILSKDVKESSDYFILDKEKRIYKPNYPDVNDYEYVFIKHIQSKY